MVKFPDISRFSRLAVTSTESWSRDGKATGEEKSDNSWQRQHRQAPGRRRSDVTV